MIEINLLPGTGKKPRNRGGAGINFAGVASGFASKVNDPLLLGAVASVAVAALVIGGMFWHQRAQSSQVNEALQKATQDSINYSGVIREQRKAVDHDLYVKCKPGPPTSGARVRVLSVKDEVFNVPVLGKAQTKAVRYEMSVPDASGKRITIASKGHLIAQDGKWRWTLSQRSLSAFLAGACP